jgi:hypothetical protein
MNGEENAIDRPLRDLGLWVGMLGPPVAWLIQFQSIYILVYSACGAQRNYIVDATCLIFFVVIAAMVVYPLRNFRETRARSTRVARTRHFMSLVSVMSVTLFLLVIVAQWIAALMIDPCVI